MGKSYPLFEALCTDQGKERVQILIDKVCLKELEKSVLIAIYINGMRGKDCVARIKDCTSERQVSALRRTGREKIEEFLTKNGNF